VTSKSRKLIKSIINGEIVQNGSFDEVDIFYDDSASEQHAKCLDVTNNKLIILASD
jgi:hypothetical protein